MLLSSGNRYRIYYLFILLIISIVISWLLATAVTLEQDEIGALANIYLPIFIGIFTVIVFVTSTLLIGAKKITVLIPMFCICLNIISGGILNLNFNLLSKGINNNIPMAAKDNKKLFTQAAYQNLKNTSESFSIKNIDGFTTDNQAFFSFAFDPNLKDSNKETTFKNHDVSTIRIKNDQKHKLYIKKATFSGPKFWAILSPTTSHTNLFPITVLPGDSLDISIKFKPTELNNRVESIWWKAILKFQFLMVNLGRTFNYQPSLGNTCSIINGQLILETDDLHVPLKRVALRSIWEYKYENDWEPGLQTILNALNFKTKVGFKYFDNGEDGNKIIPLSDEIKADYFVIADVTNPVHIQKIASYHGCCTTEDADTLAIYYPGENLVKQLQYSDQHSGQTILPTVYELKNTGSTTKFSKPFALKIDRTYTDRKKNYRQKIGIRIWKAVDANNNIIKDAYIFGSDYLGKKGTNYDYQDNVYFIRNIKPYSTTIPVVLIAIN